MSVRAAVVILSRFYFWVPFHVEAYDFAHDLSSEWTAFSLGIHTDSWKGRYA